MKVICVVTLALITLALLPSNGYAKKKGRTRLRVIVQDTEGAPVSRASVVVKTLKGKKLRKVGRSLELRTSQKGTAPLPPLKRGHVLIQVIAKGYQTFGERLELNSVDQDYIVTLALPQEQHSVHERKKE
jgi:hypothetical protein